MNDMYLLKVIEDAAHDGPQSKARPFHYGASGARGLSLAKPIRSSCSRFAGVLAAIHTAAIGTRLAVVQREQPACCPTV